MSDGFDIPINTDEATKALAGLLKQMQKFGSDADKVLQGFENQTDKAFSGAGRGASGLEKNVSSISGTLKGFGVLAIGALGVGAIKQLAGAFEGAIESAQEKQKALAGVQNALQRTGQLSAEALSDVSAFADRLEDTTGLADDTALKMFTLASSFTSSKDQAKKLVTAANDLSAATGKSLEASVTALGKSLTGTLGPLDEMDPSLKSLSKSALAAGGAIDAVLKNFGGAAAAQMDTFAGSVLTVGNKFDDLKVALGQLITDNPVVTQLIKTFGEALGSLGDIVTKNQDGIRAFMKDGILFIGEGISSLLPVIDVLVMSMGAIVKATLAATEGVLGLASAFTSFKAGEAFIKGLVNEISRLATVAISLYQGFLKLPEGLLGMAGVDITGLGEALEGVKITVAETNQEIQNSNLSASFDSAAQSVAAFKASSASTFDTISGGIGTAKTALDGYINKLKTVPSTVTTKVIATSAGGGGAGARGGGGAAGNGLPDSQELERTLGAALLRNLETAAATIGNGFLAGIQQGGEGGARKAVGSAAKGIAELAGAAGPVAGAIGSAIEILGQDPEAFKSMIQGFVDGIPVIIDNIVENIPVLVETLANNLGPIITAIIGAIPRIALAVIKSIPVVIRSILSQLSGGIGFQTDKIRNAGSGFGTSIANAHKQFNAKIFEGVTRVKESLMSFVTGQINFQKSLAEKQLEFAKKIGEFIKGQIQKNIEFTRKIVNAGRDFALKIFDVFKRIKSTFDNLIDNIRGVFGGGGGGGGGIIPGLAKGGVVPRKMQYAAGGAFAKGTDTAGPFMLTPGELVVPTDLTARLASFLDGNSGVDAATVMALLAQILAALSQPQSVSSEVKFNNKVLGEIILQLNRNGARLSA